MSLASLSATSAEGQELRPIRPPVAVRVWTSDSGVTRPIVGNALAQDSSMLRVGVANQVELAIRLAMIDSLQLRRTVRPGKGWKYGTLGALIGGTVLGLMMYSSADRDGWEGVAAGVGAVGGIAAGGLVGGIMGASRKQEEWTTVLPPIRLAMSAQRFPNGQQGFGVTVATR
jgi:hypothetical protein